MKQNKTIVKSETILKRNLKKLKKIYKEVSEYEDFKKKKSEEDLRNLFKSIGEIDTKEVK